MATLAELYEYLETKRDDEHIDSVYSYSNFSPEEWPKARLEILAWWKVERLTEDENRCQGTDTVLKTKVFGLKVRHFNNSCLMPGDRSVASA